MASRIENILRGNSASNPMSRIEDILANGGVKPSTGGDQNPALTEGKWTKLLDVREQSSQTASNYELSDSILNYDSILVYKYYTYSGRYIIGGMTIPISEIILDDSKAWYQVSSWGGDVTISFSSDGLHVYKQSGQHYIFAIYGYKLNRRN